MTTNTTQPASSIQTISPPEVARRRSQGLATDLIDVRTPVEYAEVHAEGARLAGFVAGGLLRGDHPQIDVETFLTATSAELPFVLDVRSPKEFAAGHIPGAANIPVDDLRARLGDLPRARRIAAYCQVGQRGYLATRILLQAGVSAVNIGGGYETYKLFHRPAMKVLSGRRASDETKAEIHAIPAALTALTT